MSLQFANASLAGCKPYTCCNDEVARFAKLLDEFEYGAYGFLQAMFESTNVQSFWFHGADNDDYAPCIKTDDGGAYYAARMFVGKYGAFVLLIPWSGDRERKDGVKLDHLPQIHCFGSIDFTNPNDLDIKQIIGTLTEWLSDRKKEKEAVSSVST